MSRPYKLSPEALEQRKQASRSARIIRAVAAMPSPRKKPGRALNSQASIAAAALARQRWSKPGANKDEVRLSGRFGGRPKKIIECPNGCGFSDGTAMVRSHMSTCTAKRQAQ